MGDLMHMVSTRQRTRGQAALALAFEAMVDGLPAVARARLGEAQRSGEDIAVEVAVLEGLVLIAEGRVGSAQERLEFAIARAVCEARLRAEAV
jgi:hypothetical protein